MKRIAAVVTWSGGSQESPSVDFLGHSPSILETALLLTPQAPATNLSFKLLRVSGLWSKDAILEVLDWFNTTGAEQLLWLLTPETALTEDGLRRLSNCLEDTNATIAYGDFFDRQSDGSVVPHPLIDYQVGSIRDDFDFGSILLLNGKWLKKISEEIKKQTLDLRFGGWYDLRLRLSELGPILHLPEPLYELCPKKERRSGERVFDYVDPTQREVQREMEQVASAYLERIGAFLDPPQEKPLETLDVFPVKASVIIPVKNRSRTIADAVRSALEQRASFDFNVIVVDNHSTDGTTQLVQDLSKKDRRLVLLVPRRRDLAIGGCWNEAIESKSCGKFAVQLDSDDLYAGTDVLERIVKEFDQQPVAMVIGAYSIVDFSLNPLPPGLIAHREWTDSNGHNNALRIAGLGAPRAFHVPTVRGIGFPNVSYGEDYSIGLRICRQYRIGRIYESLYWCRRWEGNSDNSLSLEVSNRYHFFKDRIRTMEIIARQQRKLHRT